MTLSDYWHHHKNGGRAVYYHSPNGTIPATTTGRQWVNGSRVQIAGNFLHGNRTVYVSPSKIDRQEPGTVKRKRLWPGFSETIYENYPRVIDNGHVMFFVGFGWIDEGQATERHRERYPIVVD